MINVTQESDNTFTISWDHEDPGESIFNSFTEQDFIEVLKYYSERSLSQSNYTAKSYKEFEEVDYDDPESDEIYHKDNNEAN